MTYSIAFQPCSLTSDSPAWIIVDSQFTMNTYCNAAILRTGSVLALSSLFPMIIRNISYPKTRAKSGMLYAQIIVEAMLHMTKIPFYYAALYEIQHHGNWETNGTL